MSTRGGRRRYHGGRGNQAGDMAVDEPNNGSGGSQNSQLKQPHVEIRQWEGGTMSDVISFLERKSRVRLQNAKQNGGVVTALIPQDQVREVEKWSGVKFAGNRLNLKIVYRTIDASPETSMAIQILQGFLNTRYNPEAKLLNLAMMMSDPTLISHKMLETPEIAVKMFKALMKLAGENLPGVESISLEGNSLASTDLILSVAETYPSLLNLSLANNQINSVASFVKLKNKLPMLRELVLAGNPIQQHPAFQSQVQELVAMFPRLLILDGVPVRSEADLPKHALPVAIRPTFFEDEQVASLTPMFLSNFFGLWDTNRKALLSLYDQASLFSLCLNTGAPHLPSSKPLPTVYIHMSRNLEKNNGQQARFNRISIGSTAVEEAFNRIPSSKHDLSNAPAFAIDAWKVSDIRTAGDTAIMMVVHGEFSELPSNQLRSFDRTLVVLPGPNGTYLVASDMLNIRAHSTLPVSSQPSQATPPSQMPPQAQPQVPPPQASTPASLATPPPTVAAPPLGAPAATQGAAVQELMKQTGLSASYAEICLKEANFDLATAFQLFQQSRAQLPPNAFQ